MLGRRREQEGLGEQEALRGARRFEGEGDSWGAWGAW